MKKLYEEANIIKQGHFKLSSGRHSNLYINKDAIYASNIFQDTVQAISHNVDVLKADIITGPAVAGAVLAAPVWFNLMNDPTLYRKDLQFVYLEKVKKLVNAFGCPECEGEAKEFMEFRRGYDKVLRDKRVIIIEDIITTGSSVMKTADSIAECGGIVVGCCCIWNRTDWVSPDFPTYSLVNHRVESWEPDECPYCKDSTPLTDPKTGNTINV